MVAMALRAYSVSCRPTRRSAVSRRTRGSEVTVSALNPCSANRGCWMDKSGSEVIRACTAVVGWSTL